MNATHSSAKAVFCVGLTGGIGCGKSSVASLFAQLGADIIDTDEISHQLTRTGGQAIPLIQAQFGADYIDGSGALNRSIMRGRVFSDINAKRTLESILHPLIFAQSKILIEQSVAPYCILVAPLLLECTAFSKLVNRVLLIHCSEDNQISRVMQRSSLKEIEIRSIINQQMPDKERLARSDDIIQNDGNFNDLYPQISKLNLLYLNTKYLTAQ